VAKVKVEVTPMTVQAERCVEEVLQDTRIELNDLMKEAVILGIRRDRTDWVKEGERRIVNLRSGLASCTVEERAVFEEQAAMLRDFIRDMAGAA
jgi:hypothetical protein